MSFKNREQIIDLLQDKEYRDLYVTENISTGLAFQIRAMRKARGWSQTELGKRAGKLQEAIVKLEDPDYGRFTIKTLKDLASAFDVALVVRFVPFSAFVNMLTNLSESDLAVPNFENDVLLTSTHSETYQGVIVEPTMLTWRAEATNSMSVAADNQVVTRRSSRVRYTDVSYAVGDPIPVPA